MNNVKIHTDISVQDKYNAKTVYAPDPQIRENYEAFVQYVRELELRMRGYGKQENVIDGLIASYECYNYTNDSEGKEVLRDLTGNGHDIQLYNFDFAEASGFGKYNENFNNLQYNNNAVKEKSATKVIIYNTSDSKTNIYLSKTDIAIGTYTYGNYIFRISGLNDTEEVNMICRYGNDFNEREAIKLHNGDNYIKEFIVNVTESNSGYKTFFDIQLNKILNKEITFEILPDYKGALVSDGVDDYGLCENFPILTKERGYTVCALRKILKPFEEIQANTCLLSNYNNTETGSFYIENRANNSWSTYSFGGVTNNLDVDYNNDFVFQTSTSYNNFPINKGENTNSISRLYLFKIAGWGSTHLPSALYALEIYDRDLTDSEIALVKERMIKRYEEKTGETYVEEVTV